MIKIARVFSLFLATVILASCATAPTFTEPHGFAVSVSDAFADVSAYDFEYSNRDTTHSYSTDGATTITLGEDAKVSGSGAEIKDGDVIITKEGTYILSGKHTSGMIYIECTNTEKVQLVLNGAEIWAPDSPAIYIKQADKVFITTVKDTVNKLNDGDKYTYLDDATEIDATVFSRADLTLNGEGRLEIIGNEKHGIVSKDDLIITGGTITVRSDKVALDGKDCVKILNGNITLNAGSDGIRSDNKDEAARGFILISGGTLNINAEKDGIQSEDMLRIDGGEITLNCGGGSKNTVESNKTEDKQPTVIDPSKGPEEDKPDSYKALKAEKDILINGGRIIADTADVCIFAEGSLHVNGGAIKLSSGGDAITANNAFYQSAGALYVTKALNAVTATKVLIKGGETSLICSENAVKATEGAEVGGGYLIIDSGKCGITAATLLLSGGVTLIAPPADGTSLTVNANTAAYGGVLVAAGNSNGINDTAKQPAVLEKIAVQSGGTSLALTDEKGNVVASFTSSRGFDNVLITSPKLRAGKTYTVNVGGTLEASDANGYINGGKLTGGTAVANVEIPK
ncbi:MAG: carbohydrate-binding domain-containing protein [Clostridia bacterium]|nr:carbohydrate-binding domain-containing protein [Clostridia bacterium]